MGVNSLSKTVTSTLITGLPSHPSGAVEQCNVCVQMTGCAGHQFTSLGKSAVTDVVASCVATIDIKETGVSSGWRACCPHVTCGRDSGGVAIRYVLPVLWMTRLLDVAVPS